MAQRTRGDSCCLHAASSSPVRSSGLLLAALLIPSVQAGSLKGDYIVVFKDSGPSPAVVAKKHKKKHGAAAAHVYRKSIKGYAAKLRKKELKSARADPRVNYVVRDGIASIAKRGGKKPPKGGGDTGSVGSWGQGRIDQRNLPLDNSYTPTLDGSGVTAYVIDTGVRIDHREFQGRASYGWDFVGNDATASDCNGHGTHVAGTIGGKTYGVADGVDIVALRVLGCSGSGWWSDIIAAMEWVAANRSGPAVTSLSIGGGYSQPVKDALASA